MCGVRNNLYWNYNHNYRIKVNVIIPELYTMTTARNTLSQDERGVSLTDTLLAPGQLEAVTCEAFLKFGQDKKFAEMFEKWFDIKDCYSSL